MYLKLKTLVELVGILVSFLYIQPTFSQVDAGSDKTSCDGTSLLYAIPPGGVWSRTGNATIVSPSSQSTSVYGLDQGANQFTYTVSGQGSDIVTVTNNQVFADAGTDRDSSCLATATLSGSAIPPSGSGHWELKYPAPGVIIDNSSSNTADVSNLPFGNTIFVWTVGANGCSASDEVSINNNTPENNDGSDIAGCTNKFYIDAEAPPTLGSGLWSVAPGSPGTPTFNNSNNPGVEITAPRGTSIARWTINYAGCTSYKNFTIVNNLPDPQAGSNQSICANTINLIANTLLPTEQGLWEVIDPQGEVISNPSINNTVVTNLKQGTTTFIWTIDNGICTLSDSLQITNNKPTSNAGRDTSICTNTYTLLANNPSLGTGVWTCSNDATVIFSNSNAYNSTVSNLKNGISKFKWTVTNASCSTTDEVNVNSNYVAITTGITSTSGCSGTLNLNATAIPPGGSGFWTVTFGTASIDNSLSSIAVAQNIQGIVRLKWTIISGGCTFNDEAEYNNLLPTQALTQTDKSVCADSTRITANAPGVNEKGLWTIESGSAKIKVGDESLFQADVKNLDQGTNYFRWTISKGICSTYDLLIVTNNKITTNAGTDQTICSKNSELNATNDGGSGYWTTSSGTAIIANSSQPNSSVSNLGFGNHTFTWTRLDKGCVASDNIVITNQLPDIVIAGSDQVVCDTIANINATNPPNGTGVWSVIFGTGIINNPNLYQTGVHQLSSGINTFRWTVSYNGCSAWDEMNVSNNKIIMNAGTNQAVCNTYTTNLSATNPGPGQNGQWSIVGGSGIFANQTLNSTSVSNLIKGINTFKWTVTDGTCSNSAQVTITNNTPDSAKVAANKSICTNTTQLNAVAVTNGTGVWSVAQGTGSFSNQNNNNTNVSNIGPGTNIYSWTVTKNSCSLAASQQITNNSVIAVIPVESMQVCRSSHDTVLTATEPTEAGTYGFWTKLSSSQATIESPSNYITRISNLANGEIRFRWTVQNVYCSATDDIRITNDYYNASATPVGSSNVCNNYTSVMGNPGPPSGTNIWSSNNPGTTFSNPSSVTSTVNSLPLGPSTIYWTITNNGCKASTSFIITNYSLTTDAGDTIRECGQNAALSAQTLEAGQSGHWTANNVNVIFENSLSPTSAVSNAPQGTSVLTWTISANGCSASDNVLLINNSFNVSAGNDKTICGTTTLLEGTAPLSGTGYWTVIEGTGKLSNSLNKTTTAANLSNGNNIFKWTYTRYGCTETDEVTITNNLYIADVLLAADVCTDTAQIQAIALPSGSGASGVWTVLLGSGAFDNNSANQTIVRNLAIGQNQFRWTVSKGTCTSYKNLNVFNNRVVVFAGTDQNTCATSISLFATPLSTTGTGQWTGPVGVTIGSPNTPGTTIYNLSRGINAFTWTVIDKGCTGSSSVNITNNSFDAYAGEDQNVTVNSAIMNASLPDVSATGSWILLTGTGSFVNNTSPTTTINNLGYGINRLRWTATWKACTAYDDIDITYNVAESHAGNDTALCQNTRTMNAVTPTFGIGTWSVVTGGGTFLNVNNPKSSVINISHGTNIYRWTVVAFSISAYDDVSVTNNSFDIYAGTDQATCNSYIDLNAESAGSGTGSWYIFQGGGTFNDNYIPNPRVSAIGTGTSKYIWRVDRNGCYDTDTVTIVKYLSPTVADAGVDAIICNSTVYLLQSNTATVGTGLWTAENTSITIDNPAYVKTVARNLSYGPNAFWWTINTAQCQSADQVIISSYNTLQITQQPVSQDLNEHGNLSLQVEATGGVRSYRWQKDGQDLIDDSRIVGSNNQTLNISNLTMADAGQYVCIVEGYCNTLTSDIANLSVISGIEALEANGIKVYPNPSNGIINIDFVNNSRVSNLEIITLNGKKVYSKPSVNQKETIDLTKSGDGIYMVYFKLGNELIRTKIIIQK